MTHGVFGWIFWLGVVGLGLLRPLLLEAVELLSDAQGQGPNWFAKAAPSAPLFALLGGLTLRSVFVYAGQISELL